MKYDFTNILDRKGNDAIALDALGTTPRFPSAPKDGFSIIPMWIADQNFKVAPSVVEAIQKRAAHASFGYFDPRQEYYDAIINWQKVRNGVDIKREEIGYENGVLGALSSALRTFTKPGDPILVHGPTYVGFTGVLASTGRERVVSMMKKDDAGVWRMDFEDMEKQVVEKNIKFAIFCSPHNPAGRVWDPEEIKAFADFCEKHEMMIFADEIWSDIILYDNKFTPTATISDYARMNSVTAHAPSKTFNLAGLIGSYRIVYNPEIQEKIAKVEEETHYNSLNVLSQYALLGAYSPEGMEWADELCQVLTENVEYTCDYLNNKLKGFEVTKPQGTFMLYIDLGKYLKETGRTLDEVLAKSWDVGVAWQNGARFGVENTIRMNVALPKWQIEEAFGRLEKYVL
ncbi:MAG: aminotransferase class I/II-fold pyridoxal phosphate-dependent enzyme [Lachnospiraceae bacterium]|nr:aminotransferase class I/II-fold pyridoxal phosphate-dependent enzyme [Lachnospiraceae bacterium]